jgi:hypothetical protein
MEIGRRDDETVSDTRHAETDRETCREIQYTRATLKEQGVYRIDKSKRMYDLMTAIYSHMIHDHEIHDHEIHVGIWL